MTLQDFQAPKTTRQLLASAVSAAGRWLEGRPASVSEVIAAEIRVTQFSLLHAEAELERSRFTVDMLCCRLERLRGHADVPTPTS